MRREKEIRSAYRNLGRAHGFYDGMMAGTSAAGRWILKYIWRKLLEIPVGTGVLSMPVFRTLPNAEIVCADCSEKMMSAAERRASEMGIRNAAFRQCDVGSLPFADGEFDAVVSLNGFHAFPDKEAAYREVFRVLKPGGVFCGCFYVAGVNAHTDSCIRRFYVPLGFFTPPFETLESLRERLRRSYSGVEVGNVQSIAYFQCVK